MRKKSKQLRQRYVCVNANCNRPATMARINPHSIQPVCDSCGRWMKRFGSTVVPIDEAIKESRD